MKNKIIISILSLFLLGLVGMSYYVLTSNALLASEYINLEKENTEILNIEKQKLEEKEKLVKENAQINEDLKKEFDNLKVVYLTFDDGPTPHHTPKILEILKKNNVKATFYVIGQNPHMYKTILDSGNTIALHTYSHNYKEIYASEEAFFKDLYKISDLVKENTGVVSKVTRFPGGSLNAGVPSAIMKKIMIRLRDEGYVYQDWNCDSTDASQNGRPVPLIIENATVKCPYKHVNLLMHDSVLKVTTVQALQQIIDYYKSRGYLFETLETYSPKFQHKKLEDIK